MDFLPQGNVSGHSCIPHGNWNDEKENNISSFEMSVDLRSPFCTWWDVAIVPCNNALLPF